MGMIMKFGIVPKEWNDFLAEAIEQAKLAEKLGFHSIWIEEHHSNKDYLPSPLMALAALSQHVPSLYVGTAVAVLPLYHPVRFAEDAAILDIVTNGKFIAGIGSGYRVNEFNAYNVPLKKKGEILEEALEIIINLWEGKKVTYNGKYFKVIEFKLEPKPKQKPRPPIWIGGWSKKAIERAAKFGDRWFPGPVGTLSTVLKGKEIYMEALRKIGKKFTGITLMRDTYVAPTEDEAIKDAEKALMHMYSEDYARSGHPLLRESKESFQEWMADRFFVGTPEQLIDIIAHLQKEGFDYIIFRVSLRGLPHRKVLSCIRILGEKVLPYFAEEERK